MQTCANSDYIVCFSHCFLSATKKLRLKCKHTSIPRFRLLTFDNSLRIASLKVILLKKKAIEDVNVLAMRPRTTVQFRALMICLNKKHIYVVVQFCFWFNVDFPLFFSMLIYDNEYQTKENPN